MAPETPMEQTSNSRFDPHLLKKTGARPIAFDGALLVQATTWEANVPCWHEGAVYETADGRFVARLTAYFKDVAQTDRFLVWTCDSPDEAIARLKDHDPDTDVPIALDPLAAFDTLDETVQVFTALLDAARRSHDRLLNDLIPSTQTDHP